MHDKNNILAKLVSNQQENSTVNDIPEFLYYTYHYSAISDIIRDKTFDGIVTLPHLIATDEEYIRFKKFIFNCDKITTLHRVLSLSLLHTFASPENIVNKDY